MDTCVYLDNNYTTIMPERVIKEMIKWSNRGVTKPKRAIEMMNIFRKEIADKCNFSLIGPNGYTIIFTSGASESNSMIITSTIRSFSKITNKQPHIIISEIEHDSIKLLAEDLQLENIDVTYIPPIKEGIHLGSIDPTLIVNAIKPNTCMISIMSANHKTGIINDIKTIGNIALNKKIPFHTDAVQTFGKFAIDPVQNNITAFSASFHKLHGPTGIGILVIKNSFIDGYKLKAIIPGNENYTLRGGIECIHNIAGAREAYKMTFEDRSEKNKALLRLKQYLIHTLKQNIRIYHIDDKITTPSIIIIPPKYSIPNTILFTIHCLHKDYSIEILQTKIKENNIYIHIVDIIENPLRMIRISLSDFNTKRDIDCFIVSLMKYLTSYP